MISPETAALSGWTGALFEQKEVTLDDINSMKEGTEYWSEGTVTLEDGKMLTDINAEYVADVAGAYFPEN